MRAEEQLQTLCEREEARFAAGMLPSLSRYLFAEQRTDASWQKFDTLLPAMYSLYLGREYEASQLICFDETGHCIAVKELSAGTADETPFFLRDILREAYACGCSICLLTHNHPASSAEASGEDTEMTARLTEVLARTGVVLLDHVILAGNRLVSLRKEHPGLWKGASLPQAFGNYL